MERAVMGDADDVAHELDGRLTKEQVVALAAKEKMLYGDGGDVKRQLPRLRDDLARETYRRLLPGYVRQYLQAAAPLIDIEIDGDMEQCFSLRATSRGAADPLLRVLDTYSSRERNCLTVVRPESKEAAVWVHPGEPVFEQFRATVSDRLGQQALRGAVFVDPTAARPYLFHVALVHVMREADPALPELAHGEVLDCQLVGVKQLEGAELALCPVEQLLLLKGGHGLPPEAQRLAAVAEKQKDQAAAFLTERVARGLAMERRASLLGTLPEREQFIQRGFNYQESELAAARVKQSEKARGGNAGAMKALREIKDQQRSLAERRAAALATIRREPELIVPGNVTFIAHALIVPSTNADDLARHDAEVERIAMDVARVFEEAEGAVVHHVHTPELARATGLTDNPGFDLLAIYPEGDRRGRRAIEVKGRANTGDVEVSANEWARAANLRDGYWLYVVYGCATPSPRLARVQDPFGTLLAKERGGVLIAPLAIAAAELSEGGKS